MISEKLLKMINEQIQFEYYSRNVYFGMESYLRDQSYDGFANFMKVQADEEMLHCRYFMEYLIKVGAKFEMLPIDGATNEFESVQDVFKKALDHEKEVTRRIYALYSQAVEDKDYFAQRFLSWYVDEQAEEEDNFNTLVTKLERTSTEAGLMIIDQELSTRVLTPPANPPVTL